MAKEVSKVVKLQVRGGQANPSPPVGPALGAAGVNIMEFCKQFNARSQDKMGQVLPVVISVYTDKSFDFGEIWKLPREGQKYTVYPGELVILLGDTGLGKTAFVQNLVANLPNLTCLYYESVPHKIN